MTNTDDTKPEAAHTSAINLSCSHKPINSQSERNPMLTKKCMKCQINKDVTQFFSWNGGKDGLRSWCKSCCRDYQRDYQRRRRQAWATRMSNATPQVAESLTDGFVPNILHIPIRSDRVVMVGNIPFDLTRGEADRIERIVKAFVVDNATDGESS